MLKSIHIAVLAIAFTATIVSVVCIIMAGSAGLNSKSLTTKSLYFLKSDTTPYSESFLESAFVPSNSSGVEYASVSFWNYCFMLDSHHPGLWCSKPSLSFSFDPLALWHLKQGNSSIPLLSGSAVDSIPGHAWATKFLVGSYIIAAVTAILTFVAGAISSWIPHTRILSNTVIALSSTSAATMLIASSVATASFSSIKNEINMEFDFNLFHLGTAMFVVLWFAASFNIIAAIFWGLSMRASGEGERQWKRAGLSSSIEPLRVGHRYGGLQEVLRSGIGQKWKKDNVPKPEQQYEGDDVDRSLIGNESGEKGLESKVEVKDFSSLSGDLSGRTLFDPYEPYRSESTPARERGISPGRGASPYRTHIVPSRERGQSPSPRNEE